MAGITAGRLEARFEDVGGRVVGGQQQDVASLGGRTVRQGRAARDAGGQGEGHEGEAVVGYFALEVAADKVVHVSGFHSENPFGIMTCALKKGIGDGTVVEGCQAQVRGGWVWSDLMFVSLCSVYHREKTSEGRKQKQPPKGWGNTHQSIKKPINIRGGEGGGEWT